MLRYSITSCMSQILSHARGVWDIELAQQATSDSCAEPRDRNKSEDSYQRIFRVHVRDMIDDVEICSHELHESHRGTHVRDIEHS